MEFRKEMFAAAVVADYQLDIMVCTGDYSFDNELGEGHYDCHKGDIVLRGTVGERWQIPVKKLSKYEMLDGSAIVLEDISDGKWHRIKTRKSDAITWFCRVPISLGQMEVTTPDGHTLVANSEGYDHGEGDMVCCSDNNGNPTFEWGIWPVNGRVFANTYRPL